MLHESMRYAFVRVDMHGKIIEFNELFYQLLDYSPEEARKLAYQEITHARWHVLETMFLEDFKEQFSPK